MTEYTQEDAERYFDLKLQKVNQKVRDEYYRLLLEKQIKSAGENNDQLVTISTQEREALFKRANTNIFVGRVDSKRMGKAWDKASREGRGPIGGAPDD